MEKAELSPLLYAYLGDAILEVMVRERLVYRCADTGACNKEALQYVTAGQQAVAAKRIRDLLNPEEEALFLHARNAKAHSVPQHADLYDYRLATGFEALFGYLHLSGDRERMEVLFKAAYPNLI